MEHSFQPGSEDASMSMLLKAAGGIHSSNVFVRTSEHAGMKLSRMATPQHPRVSAQTYVLASWLLIK